MEIIEAGGLKIDMWKVRADAKEIAVGMFVYASEDLLKYLNGFSKTKIGSNTFDSTWYRAVYTMLPKTEDASEPGCWRSIAVLKIDYNNFCLGFY